jgi:hypothetical protein
MIILIAYTAKGQIAGVSNDKLIVVNPASIGIRTVEFEPGFGYLWTKYSYNDEGKLVPLSPQKDSIQILQALGFRFTYGFAKNFEIGAFVTSSLNAFSLGVKYTFVNHDQFTAGTFLGTNFSNESDFTFRNTGIFGKTAAIVGGFAFMHRFGESKKLSIDYDVQYQNTFDSNTSYSDDIFASAELGYEFKESTFQIATGLNYRYNNYKNGDPTSWGLTWNTGILIHSGKMFNLIVNIPIDIAGKNTGRYNGFQIVLTITLD